MFSHKSSHRVTPIRTLRTQPTLIAEQVTGHFVNPRLATRAHRTAAEDACLCQAQVINVLFQFHCGAMASSAVSSVPYMRDETENRAESPTSA